VSQFARAAISSKLQTRSDKPAARLLLFQGHVLRFGSYEALYFIALEPADAHVMDRSIMVLRRPNTRLNK